MAKIEQIRNKNELDKLVFLDETGIDNNEGVNYAWSPKGTRAYATKLGHKTERVSLAGAKRLKQNKIFAPFLFQGNCNREIFEIFLEKVLLPLLQPKSILVLDNASIHKGGRIKALVEAAGCELLYLPPYSPDFNPIEQCWSPLKNRIRKLMSLYEGDVFRAAEHAFS